MAYENIQNAENGFSTIAGSFTCLPVFAFFKSEGVASEGFVWDDVELATQDIGADGLGTKNSKPIRFVANATYKPNSSTRKYLDKIVALSTVTYGKKPTDYELTYTEVNYLTQTKTIYSGGIITNASSGNSATMDEGQQSKKYTFSFLNKVELPL